MMERHDYNNPWADKLSQVSLPDSGEAWKAMEVLLDKKMPAGRKKDWRRWFLLILLLLLLIRVCNCPGRGRLFGGRISGAREEQPATSPTHDHAARTDTGARRTATNVDRTATNVGRMDTGIDRTATGVDRMATGVNSPAGNPGHPEGETSRDNHPSSPMGLGKPGAGDRGHRAAHRSHPATGGGKPTRSVLTPGEGGPPAEQVFGDTSVQGKQSDTLSGAGVRGRDNAGVRGRDGASVRGKDSSRMRGKDSASVRGKDSASVRGKDSARLSGQDSTVKSAAKPGPKLPEEKKKKEKDNGWTVGIGLNQFFTVGGQQASHYNSGGISGTLSDYIPVPMIRYHFNRKLYLQLEAQFNSPQYTRKNLLISLPPVDSLSPVQARQSSVSIKKLFYFNVPFSIHYNFFRTLDVGAGIQFSRLSNGIGLFEDRLINSRSGSTDSISSASKSFKGDTLYKKIKTNEFRILLDASYTWKSFIFGVRYNQALNKFINIQVAPGQITQARNSSLQLYLRYILWDTRKRPLSMTK